MRGKKVNKEIKTKVLRLRSEGNTYSEIRNMLRIEIAKSTMSIWCRNVKLPVWYKEKIKNINNKNLIRIRPIAHEVNRKKRSEYLRFLLQKNSHLLKKLDKPTQKLLLSILYLGEGAKYKSSQMLSLGSSSPDIIKFYLKLLQNCYNIDESKFRVRIQCRFDQNIKLLESFWLRLTKLKKIQFYPTYIDVRTKGKPTLKKGYKGVCTIHYFSTEIQLELELLANAIMSKII